MTRVRVPESVIQRQAAALLDRIGVLWVHVPNEGRRSRVSGALLKAAGMKAGYPDITIFDAPPKIPGRIGMAIELKAQGGRANRAQIDWLAALSHRGFETCVAVGWDGLVAELRRAGYLSAGSTLSVR